MTETIHRDSLQQRQLLQMQNFKGILLKVLKFLDSSLPEIELDSKT